MTVEVIKIKDTGHLGILMIKGKFGLDNIYTDSGTKMLGEDEYEHYGEMSIDDDTESRKTTERNKKSKK